MNLPKNSLKFLRLALCPSVCGNEMVSAAVAFVKCLRKEGFSLPPESIGAASGVMVAHSQPDKIQSIVEALREQKQKADKKRGTIPRGIYKGWHVSKVATDALFYYYEKADFKKPLQEEIRLELDKRGLI